MNNGFFVIDADRHIMEPSDLWDRYLEPEFKGRVRITGPFQSRRYVDGRSVSDSDQLPRDRTYNEEAMSAALFTEDPLYRSVFGDSVARGFDPASNMRDMDREGVDVAVLFPTLGLYIIWDDEIEAGISAAICRAYNNWLADYCSHDRARLKGVALIPLHDTRLAVEELRRAKNELGLSGIFWRPNRLKGRTFGHPDYFPIYEVAPELKVAQLESGCGWLPYWLERMDEHWKHYTLGRERTTRELPSTYWKRQCVISCEAGEELVGCFVEHVGDDQLIMATDYPHADAAEKFPERTVGDLAKNTDLSEATRRKILWDNPARLYGIRETPNSRGADRRIQPS
jgi:predicted TIM-barrel fold metal-dependent hydrolase